MRSLALLGSFALLVCPSLTRAQSAEPSFAPVQVFDASRTLNGHAFLPLIGVPWPFVATWVGSRTGVGVYALPVEPLRALGITIDDDALLVSFSELFDFSVALTRWLGVSVALSATHAIGVNESGAFNVGLNYAYGGEGAVIARLLHGRHWHLALRFQANTSRVAGIVPANLAAAVRVENGVPRFNLAAVVSEGHHVRGTASLVLAESHTRYVGVQASVGMDVTRVELDRVAERNGNFNAGLGASVRFDELGVPLAWLIGGALRTRVDRFDEDFFLSIQPRGRLTGQVETGLLYSDPKYVDLGLQLSLELGETDKRGQARFVLNHFW